MRQIAVMTGRAGAGKTTIAKYLVEHAGFERVRFAGPLKAMAKAIGLNDDEIDGGLKDSPCSKLTFEGLVGIEGASCPFDAIGINVDDFRRVIPVLGGRTSAYAVTTLMYVLLSCIAKGGPNGATPRSLMQMIGTEWGRNMIREDLWVELWRQAVDAVPEGVPIVIDDCRFPNELAECRAKGRTAVFKIERDTPSVLTGIAEKAHESEAHALPHDAVVLNKGQAEDAGKWVLEKLSIL